MFETGEINVSSETSDQAGTDADDGSDSATRLWTNGVHVSGRYLLPPPQPHDLLPAIEGDARGRTATTADHLQELSARRAASVAQSFGLTDDRDPAQLSETGWGVILPYAKAGTPEEAAGQQILEALAPLLTLRKAQVASDRRFQIFAGERGYRAGESKQGYLARLGAAPGPANPDSGVPYYLLIVASPEAIPFHIQYQIDVQYAVGRLQFDTLDEYANYARTVVAAETGQLVPRRELAFFGVANENDQATQLSHRLLVKPLAQSVEGLFTAEGWSVQRWVDGTATRAALLARLLGPEGTQGAGSASVAPALLFTASHGVGFDAGDPRQERQQGALLCQDWPGPTATAVPIRDDYMLNADHIPEGADLGGMIAFHFACYGAGTPRWDEFPAKAGGDRVAIATRPFVAALPRRMLGLRRGGALAVIGHIERAWPSSFAWGTGRRGAMASHVAVFESALLALLRGLPVGAALEYFNARYAELASDLTRYLEDTATGGRDPFLLSDLWTANNDARGYAVIGDPAVRLPMGPASPDDAPVASVPTAGSPRVDPAAPTNRAMAALAETEATPSAAPDAMAGDTPEDAPVATAATTADTAAGDLRAEWRALATRVIDHLRALGPVTVRTVAQDAAGARTVETRIGSDGQIETVHSQMTNPADGDDGLWQRHQAEVAAAQAGRVEVMKVIASLLADKNWGGRS